MKTVIACLTLLTSSSAFAQESQQEPNTVTLKSGVIIQTLKAGTGPKPGPRDTVKVHYRGTLPDGTEFDTSNKSATANKSETPSSFPLSAVIPCWTDGLQKVSAGSKVKLVCPPSTAYGAKGAPPKVPADATLLFTIELLEIIREKSR